MMMVNSGGAKHCNCSLKGSIQLEKKVVNEKVSLGGSLSVVCTSLKEMLMTLMMMSNMVVILMMGLIFTTLVIICIDFSRGDHRDSIKEEGAVQK